MNLSAKQYVCNIAPYRLTELRELKQSAFSTYRELDDYKDHYLKTFYRKVLKAQSNEELFNLYKELIKELNLKDDFMASIDDLDNHEITNVYDFVNDIFYENVEKFLN